MWNTTAWAKSPVGAGGWIGGALAAGISADIAGGHFGSAFAAAGVSGLIGGLNLQGAESFIASTIAGGIASEITGGKFANGASTAAFIWAIRAGTQEISDKYYSDSGSDNRKYKHTKNGERPTGRDSFSEEKIEEIDSLSISFQKSLLELWLPKVM